MISASHSNRYTKVELAIVVSACIFIFALAVSAYFEPRIRLLHTLQALIYIFVIVLARRHSKWAYGVGLSIAAFWNYANLFVTTFIRNGLENLHLLVSGKPVIDGGALIALPAALGHFGMIVFCIWAYVNLRDKRWSDVFVLVASAFLSIGYFALIVALTGPQYLPIFRRVFHI